MSGLSNSLTELYPSHTVPEPVPTVSDPSVVPPTPISPCAKNHLASSSFPVPTASSSGAPVGQSMNQTRGGHPHPSTTPSSKSPFASKDSPFSFFMNHHLSPLSAAVSPQLYKGSHGDLQRGVFPEPSPLTFANMLPFSFTPNGIFSRVLSLPHSLLWMNESFIVSFSWQAVRFSTQRHQAQTTCSTTSSTMEGSETTLILPLGTFLLSI